MKNLNVLGLLGISMLITPAALAQPLTFPSYDPSVTLYALDGPSVPVRYNAVPQMPERALSPAPVNTTVNTTVNTATSTTEAAVEAIEGSAAPKGVNWKGRVNFGASLQTGNTEEEALNADATLSAKWAEVHRATLKADYNFETNDDVETEDNKSIEGQYDYFFAEKWFFNSVVGFEQDDIDQLDLRTTAGIGLGYQPYESDDLNLQFVLGPTYLHEEFENGTEEDDLAARWALDYDQRIWDNALQLFHEHEILTPVEETDRFLFQSESGVRVPINKGLVATAQIDFDWDNEPEPGVVEDDTLYSLKLGYEWPQSD